MNVVMTKHARDRALDMCVEGAEIRECLSGPSVTYPDGGGVLLQRGRIVLACIDEGVCRVVKTVLWADELGWMRDRFFGSYGGRFV